jgi:hypothetical protein
VIVFARAPVPGAAKTRLIPRLGAWRAAALQARLTARALRTASAARVGEVTLCVTPRRNSPAFRPLAGKQRVEIGLQRGRDLGERMAGALARALRRRRAAIVIGTDCPALTPRDLRRAARLLRGHCDAVLAPAEDGGYVLVGMKKPCPQFFDGIEWGSDSVLRDTLARAHGLKVKLLRTLWDVDRPEDLARLRSLRFS